MGNKISSNHLELMLFFIQGCERQH